MKIIEHISKFVWRNGVLIFTVAIIAAWFFAGTPIPGRYQMVSSPSGDAGIKLLDTMTGKIRIFVARRIGTEAYSRVEGSLELVELTK